jgi:metal-sulfur cluster biosynthetic enzyme
MALISARRRQPCVVRSSSPAQRSTGGVSSKTTIQETYSNPPVLVQPIDQMSCERAHSRGHWGFGSARTLVCAHSRRLSTLVGMATVDEVTDALREVIDPELGLDFVELGLIYEVAVDDGSVQVTYTLTSPGCPIGPQVAEQIEEFVMEVDGVNDVQSTMTFTPPWTPELMSEDAKFALGF